MARRQQRVVEIPRGVLAPALVAVLVALVDAGIEHIGGRRGRLVQTAVGAAQPAQVDAAFGHVERAARQVDARPRLRHSFLAAQRDRAALRRPFADAMPAGAQIAAHFQQAAGRCTNARAHSRRCPWPPAPTRADPPRYRCCSGACLPD
ncbi:hypothetical protein X973_15490 [Piscirickettsia salmonis]|nr:hypothetical protein X973_15490 [Piscirickettsia salmonis]